METRMGDRPRRRRPEPSQALADEDLPLDHHVEEVLAALRDFAGLHGVYPSDSESRP
jgi:hypothetical protein